MKKRILNIFHRFDEKRISAFCWCPPRWTRPCFPIISDRFRSSTFPDEPFRSTKFFLKTSSIELVIASNKDRSLQRLNRVYFRLTLGQFYLMPLWKIVNVVGINRFVKQVWSLSTFKSRRKFSNFETCVSQGSQKIIKFYNV